MLKRTKSANQSVIQDAVDKDNTAVTLAGPSQPDEDDYGYVSQEAAAFYNKMMEKYSKMPDEPKFSLEKKKKVNTNLNSLKNKVIAALDREQEEANMPHRRKRKRREEDGTDQDNDHDVYEESRREEAPVRSKPKPAAPPPLNFAGNVVKNIYFYKFSTLFTNNVVRSYLEIFSNLVLNIILHIRMVQDLETTIFMISICYVIFVF